ncbi:pentapeptide repeat-containing protein [Buchananella hordeovulneris]|uniref:pentapeptide repeat-containing protein n=1 Tax=Buchananella hordeovulneris TaxID=52770 RepID=UPI000F5E50D1|nr:pentapeptide repeat-containing protein [Buchananella hordeovulneris]RRD52948.1 pentapeptide repeat-containing protein [Buchananella hordeovulneris]
MTAWWRQLTGRLAAGWLRLAPARRRTAACRLQAAEQQLTRGAAATSARLAAVRELVTIADTYQGRYKQRVVDLLCAHLRAGTAAEPGMVRAEVPQENNAVAAGAVPPRTAEPGVSAPADPVQALVLAEIARHLARGRARRAASRQPSASATGVPSAGAVPKEPVVPASSWAQCGFDLRGVHLTADVNWADCYFAGPVCFAGAVLDGEVQLRGATFRDGPDFSSARFRSAVDCSQAKFGAAASFRQASFARRTTFAHSRFGARADFSDCLFAAAPPGGPAVDGYQPPPSDTYFSSARFGPEVSFHRAVFRGYAMFPFARFAAAPCFRAARFELAASFYGARLGTGADFRDTTFLPGRQRPRYLDDLLDAQLTSFDTAKFGPGATFAGANFASRVSFTAATGASVVS